MLKGSLWAAWKETVGREQRWKQRNQGGGFCSKTIQVREVVDLNQLVGGRHEGLSEQLTKHCIYKEVLDRGIETSFLEDASRSLHLGEEP